MYRGLRIIRQAEKHKLFRLDDRWNKRFAFSHIYTAADQIAYQKFLGIDAEDVEAIEPVPEDHYESLRSILLWMYGQRSSDDQPVIRTQNPDLGRLREVLGKESAIDLLRRGHSLDRAWEESLGTNRRFREALIEAKVQIQDALVMAPTGYEGDPEQLETAIQINMSADALVGHMKRVIVKDADTPQTSNRSGDVIN